MAQFKWSVVCRAVGQREHCTAMVFFQMCPVLQDPGTRVKYKALFTLYIMIYQPSIRLL